MMLHNKCQIEQNSDILIATIHDKNSSDNQINLRINDKKTTNTITKAKKKNVIRTGTAMIVMKIGTLMIYTKIVSINQVN